MKKHLLLAALAIISGFLPAAARDFTYTYQGQTLTYTVLDESAKTVETKKGSTDNSGNLVIPSVAKDGNIEYRVTQIGNWAFSGCNSLLTVTIPNSVTSIAEYAFSGCSGLTHVELPNSITAISDDVFMQCTSLTSVKIPDSVTSIGIGAFGYCSSLTSVDIPSSVKSIGLGAFCMCSNLTSVTLPNSLTKIENQTFIWCSKLASVEIPNSVTSIGEFAFKSSGLTSVKIPSSITSISNYAFYDCSSLISVNYDAEEPIVAESTVFDASTYERAVLYVNPKAIEKCKEIDPWKNFTTIQPNESGLEEVAAEFDAKRPCEVFNLGGVKVADSADGLAPGIYIMRQGNTVKKIAVQ